MEVDQCCCLIDEISRATIAAYPLVQSQHPNVRGVKNIEHGTVFFSTTVAETSLTFPSLKYVVDTGMINTPIYDIESKRTILKEVRAAQSTIKQRLGRLGRTQSGEYDLLYSFKVNDLLYPIPQICQSDLMNNEFSLRKSPLQKGLDYMKTFLPDKPSQQSIDTTIQQSKQLELTEIEEKLTNEQLEYLNAYYMVEKVPRPHQLQLICIEWNINNFYFFLDLEAWFFGRWMAEQEREQRLRLARQLAA
ncbi:unnamed protein product [Adineta steineri]|uniref:Uncharacterized protein n=1 Tax=Adineta steineri TaxID=433720 RepID=A0A818PJR2_9BILA|nr:unnamed protein product [Adineta steineri]CAF3624152.1 unnamed protein product [Adineta steineri]